MSIFEIALRPVFLLLPLLLLLTYLLRHRLFLYATASRIEGGGSEHTFVIRNQESVPLDVPLKLSVSTMSNPARITSVRLHCGKQGPTQVDFRPEGHERYVLVVLGIPAMDSWKIVCRANDEAESVRLQLRGWDVKRNGPRWWFPVLSQQGQSIASRRSAVAFELSRPVTQAGIGAIVLLLLAYASAVRTLSIESAHYFDTMLIGPFMRWVWAHSPTWNWRLDAWLLGGLLASAAVTLWLNTRGRPRPVPLGYLGDEYLHEVFDRYNSEAMLLERATSPRPAERHRELETEHDD